MEQKTLFEIPIYSMAEKEFNKRWKKRKDFLYDMLIRGKNTEDDVKLFVSQSCFPECIWKYNQIIGFIQISVSRHDVRFDISLSLDKNIMLKVNISTLFKTYTQMELIFMCLHYQMNT